MLIVLLVAAAMAYQVLAIAAVAQQLLRRETLDEFVPPVSILKPVRGLDIGFYEAIRSHALQEYPEFEILFGASDLNDPAVGEIKRLIAEFPHIQMRLIHSMTPARNGKVGVLTDLAAAARYRVLLVNDSDILVERDYLRRVMAPLADKQTRVVTCVYRARAASIAGKWEAVGIATDFAPSTLVAPLVGVNEFGLGATLLFRASDLESIGGFPALADYLADDYQLARRLVALGGRAVMSTVVVETHLGAPSWRDVWRHQVRWARTIKVSRGGGFLGLPFTHAGFWILLAALSGHVTLAISLLALRWLTAILGGAILLRSTVARRAWFLAPLWDVWALMVWVAAFMGNTIHWRGLRLRLNADGRIGD